MWGELTNLPLEPSSVTYKQLPRHMELAEALCVNPSQERQHEAHPWPCFLWAVCRPANSSWAFLLPFSQPASSSLPILEVTLEAPSPYSAKPCRVFWAQRRNRNSPCSNRGWSLVRKKTTQPVTVTMAAQSWTAPPSWGRGAESGNSTICSHLLRPRASDFGAPDRYSKMLSVGQTNTHLSYKYFNLNFLLSF